MGNPAPPCPPPPPPSLSRAGAGPGGWGRGPSRGPSGGPRGRGSPRPPPCPDGLSAPGGGRLALRDPLREERGMVRRRPRGVGGGAARALPPYQVAGPAAEGLADEKPLHRRPGRSRRPRSGARVGWAGPGRARVAGFEPVDVDRGTALEAAR